MKFSKKNLLFFSFTFIFSFNSLFSLNNISKSKSNRKINLNNNNGIKRNDSKTNLAYTSDSMQTQINFVLNRAEIPSSPLLQENSLLQYYLESEDCKKFALKFFHNFLNLYKTGEPFEGFDKENSAKVADEAINKVLKKGDFNFDYIYSKVVENMLGNQNGISLFSGKFEEEIAEFLMKEIYSFAKKVVKNNQNLASYLFKQACLEHFDIFLEFFEDIIDLESFKNIINVNSKLIEAKEFLTMRIYSVINKIKELDIIFVCEFEEEILEEILEKFLKLVLKEAFEELFNLINLCESEEEILSKEEILEKLLKFKPKKF